MADGGGGSGGSAPAKAADDDGELYEPKMWPLEEARATGSAGGVSPPRKRWAPGDTLLPKAAAVDGGEQQLDAVQPARLDVYVACSYFRLCVPSARMDPGQPQGR
jgi:hypothetical protein